MNNGCYSWHPTMSSSASSSNNSSLVPSPPPEKTIILNPFRKRNRNKNKNNNVNVYPWNPSHNNFPHYHQNGYHSYNGGGQNNGYTNSQRSPLRYNNNGSFSLQPQQPHYQTSSQQKDSSNVLPDLKLTRNIHWPGGSMPLSTPLCGFEVKTTDYDLLYN